MAVILAYRVDEVASFEGQYNFDGCAWDQEYEGQEEGESVAATIESKNMRRIVYDLRHLKIRIRRLR